MGVASRLVRISPDVPLQYKDWTIPPGVSHFLSLDPWSPLPGILLWDSVSDLAILDPRQHVYPPHSLEPRNLPYAEILPARALAATGLREIAQVHVLLLKGVETVFGHEVSSPLPDPCTRSHAYCYRWIPLM